MTFPDDYINKIICADCLDIMKQMPDKCVDLVLTDPPYGIKRFKKGFGYTRFKNYGIEKTGILWDNKPEKRYFDEIFRISKNQIIWGANNFNLPPHEHFFIWDKQQTVNNFAECEYAYTSLKIPAKIFKYSIHKHNQVIKKHPTQKPVELMKWCILKDKTANIIFDPFLGSGTTAVACKELNRKFIGVEISPDYCKIAETRLKNTQESFVF